METDKNSKDIVSRYHRYLELGKSYSVNTLDACMHDADELFRYPTMEQAGMLDVKLEGLEYFTAFISDFGIGPRPLVCILNGVYQFYHFLVVDDHLEADPIELLEPPKQSDRLPGVLSAAEVGLLEQAIDLSKWGGYRDRAIIEVLFSYGLHVSELTNLKLSNLYIEEQYIRVMDKDSKERLVPISPHVLNELNYWLVDYNVMKIKPGGENYVFLSHRGQHLARTVVLITIKWYAVEVGIKKTILPYTLRHSFATSSFEGSADLRIIQAMLGHENTGTAEIYTYVDTSILRQEILEHRSHNIQYNGHQQMNLLIE